jgi:hypothetical protein
MEEPISERHDLILRSGADMAIAAARGREAEQGPMVAMVAMPGAGLEPASPLRGSAF